MKPCIVGGGYRRLRSRWQSIQSRQALQETFHLSIGSRLRAVRPGQPEDTGMKEVRNIADRGGKHYDPVNGPPGTLGA